MIDSSGVTPGRAKRRRPRATAVVGIDAGGSTTRLAVASGSTREVFTAGAGNYVTLGAAAFRSLLARSWREARRATGIPAGAVAAVCLGGAGLGRRTEQRRAERVLTEQWPRARIRVTTDADLFLRAAFGGRPGIVLMAGTGSICLGRTASRSPERAGGWGAILEDPGSAFDLGRRAVLHLLAVRDGLKRTTPFAAALAAHLEAGAEGDLPAALSGLYAGGPRAIAALAPVVLERARRADTVAERIISQAATALARLARAVAQRLGDTSLPVALGGGLVRNRAYARAVTGAVERVLPEARVFVSRREPVLGALDLAREQVAHDR